MNRAHDPAGLFDGDTRDGFSQRGWGDGLQRNHGIQRRIKPYMSCRAAPRTGIAGRPGFRHTRFGIWISEPSTTSGEEIQSYFTCAVDAMPDSGMTRALSFRRASHTAISPFPR